MAKAPNYSWPSRADSQVIGKDHDRLDGLVKSTGKAKYTYDINLPHQLIARAPPAHQRPVAFNERRMAHAHARHIRNGVERTGRQPPVG